MLFPEVGLGTTIVCRTTLRILSSRDTWAWPRYVIHSCSLVSPSCSFPCTQPKPCLKDVLHPSVSLLSTQPPSKSSWLVRPLVVLLGCWQANAAFCLFSLAYVFYIQCIYRQQWESAAQLRSIREASPTVSKPRLDLRNRSSRRHCGVFPGKIKVFWIIVVCKGSLIQSGNRNKTMWLTLPITQLKYQIVNIDIQRTTSWEQFSSNPHQTKIGKITVSLCRKGQGKGLYSQNCLLWIFSTSTKNYN